MNPSSFIGDHDNDGIFSTRISRNAKIIIKQRGRQLWIIHLKRREGKRSIFFVEEEKRESNDSFKEERMIISLIIITGNDFIIMIFFYISKNIWL